MRSIFTYPLNQATDYVDPRYIGTATTGWKKRVNDLLSGTYLSWPALDPVADLGTTVNQAIQMQSRFTYYLDSYKIGGPDYNLSMYDLHSLPIAIGRKKLLDSEEVSSAVLTGVDNVVEITFTNTHTFSNGDTVTIDNFDGTIGQEPPLDFNVEVVDTDTIKLKDGQNNYFRYYILEYADISTGGATAATPCVFTVTSHTLTDGTLVQLSGFDGTLNEKNGDNFYVQNSTSTTFELSYDQAGTTMLAYQAPNPDLPILEFELQTNGDVWVQLDDPLLFDRTSVTFDTSTGSLNTQPFSTAMFDLTKPTGPYPNGLYLQNIGTPGEGYYKIFKDFELTSALSWAETDGDMTESDFATLRRAQTVNGQLRLHDPAYAHNVSAHQYKNKTITHLQTESSFDINKLDFGTVYYTDDTGIVHTDSGLTTAVDVSHWTLPQPVVWMDGNFAGSVAHSARVYDDADVEIDITTNVIIDHSSVTAQSDIIGLNYIGEDPTGATTIPTNLDYQNRTFAGDTDQNVYGVTGFSPPVQQPAGSDYPVQLATGESYLGNDDIPRGEMLRMRVRQYLQRLPVGDPQTVNPVFTAIDDANDPTLANTPYVMSDGTNRVVVVPYEKDSFVGGEEYWDCFTYLINADGNPDNVASLSDFTDSSGGTVTDFARTKTRLFNPVWSNGESNPTQPDMLQDSQYSRVFTSDDYILPGTIITMDTLDYVCFYVGKHDVGAVEKNCYYLFSWNGSVIDWTATIPTMSPNPQTINTVNQNYYTVNPNGHTGYKTGYLGYYYYQRYYNAWASGNPTDPFSSVFLNDQPGSTVDVINLGVTNSTVGEVTEVYTPADGSQKTKTSFTDSTSGFVAISTSNPTRYELRDLELIMPGTQVYSYLDSGGNTAYGARVEPDWYYESGKFEPTYLGLASPEEYPDFTVGVDGNGRLNGTFTMALKPSETTFGRFINGETICFPIRSLADQYVAPTVPDAEQQDIWDTDDEWTTNGFDVRKEWPYHVSPSKATINLNSPTIVNKSQNGIKYSRKSSHTKWTLEVEYPPMTADDFSLFHATAQAAQGQAVPFYFVLRNKDNTPILWADFMRDIDSGDVTQTFRYLDNYSSGDTVMMLDGFDSFETDAFRKGEIFIGSGNENGSLHTVINQVDANAYGEAKVRLAYPLRSGVSKGGSGYKDVYHAIVTLNSDDFMYQIDTDGYYRMSVSFDLDGWK